MTAPSAKPLFRAMETCPEDVVRFFSKVSAPTNVGCMEWMGCIGRGGYGHIRWNRRVTDAHRVALYLATGEWPTRHVLHSCDNPRCCNPAHLREGTHQENMKDCANRKRNRSPRPGNGRAKLSADDIISIRRRFNSGETNKSALAREFGVTAPRIRQIVTR